MRWNRDQEHDKFKQLNLKIRVNGKETKKQINKKSVISFRKKNKYSTFTFNSNKILDISKLLVNSNYHLIVKLDKKRNLKKKIF